MQNCPSRIVHFADLIPCLEFTFSDVSERDRLSNVPSSSTPQEIIQNNDGNEMT